MKRKNYTSGLLSSLFIFLFLIPGISGFTQEKITLSILEPIWVVPDTILPLAVTDITGSAETTAGILSEINSNLPDSALMADFEQRLTYILLELDSINEEFSAFEGNEISTKEVLKTSNSITVLLSDKEALKTDLEEALKNLQDDHLRTQFLTNTWETTIRVGRVENYTIALIDRSEQVLGEIGVVGQRINEKADSVIYYGDQLLGGTKILEDIRSRTSEIEELFQLKYLGKTHAAIWESDTIAGSDSASLTLAIRDIRETYSEGISNFYSGNSTMIFLNLGILIILLIISYMIKRNLKKSEIKTEDERILTFLKIFNRPIAMSLMLALFIFILLYPEADPVAREIGSFAILIPLIIISLQVLQKRWYILLFVLVGLFLFEEFVETLYFEAYPLPRYLLLGIMCASLAYIIWEVLKRKKELKYVNKFRIRATDLAIWISLIIILSAIISNIIGYVPLSFFLFRGLIISAIAGLLISVTVTIIDGFFTLLIMGGSSHMYDVIREYGNKLVSNILRVVKLFAIFYWTYVVLRRFLILDNVRDWLTGILETKWEFNEMLISVKGILLFFLIIFLSFWFSRFIRLLLDKEVFPRVKFSRGIPGIINLIIRVSIVTLGLLFSLAALGITLDKLTLLIGAMGVGIGFGLQDIINNLISGFILVFERPIQVGDTVKFAEREGIVKEIGIRASTIKTYDGTEVIVPNGKLISNELINLTLSDPMLRIDIDIGTDYESDPQEVIDVLVMQAKLHPDVMQTPEAFAIFFGFGDYALNFRLYAYTLQVGSRLRIRSELNLAISTAFKEAGIKIPFPKQDIEVKLKGKEEKKK